ncbi:MAG: hypothetical protein QM739_05270 [Propionivibrio sp.]
MHDAVEHGGEGAEVDTRQHDADRVRLVAQQFLGQRIGAVTGLVDDLLDNLTDLRIDVSRAIDDARHRRDRNSRHTRHILDIHPTPEIILL